MRRDQQKAMFARKPYKRFIPLGGDLDFNRDRKAHSEFVNFKHPEIKKTEIKAEKILTGQQKPKHYAKQIQIANSMTPIKKELESIEPSHKAKFNLRTNF